MPQEFDDGALLDLDVHLIPNVILIFILSKTSSHSRPHQPFRTPILSFYITMYTRIILHYGNIWRLRNAPTIKAYGTPYISRLHFFEFCHWLYSLQNRMYPQCNSLDAYVFQSESISHVNSDASLSFSVSPAHNCKRMKYLKPFPLSSTNLHTRSLSRARLKFATRRQAANLSIWLLESDSPIDRTESAIPTMSQDEAIIDRTAALRNMQTDNSYCHPSSVWASSRWRSIDCDAHSSFKFDFKLCEF
jgi:hypothetical protein